MIPIRTKELEDLKSKVPADQHETIHEAVADCNVIVNIIEGRPPTTQYWYGDYMVIITDMNMAAMFLCAGANKEGVAWALKIHGLI